MSNEPTYADGEALQQSLAASARANFQVSGVPVSNALARMIFDRFLCRVFSEPDAGFALKGGTGMLARIPLGRATQDVDLEHRTHTLSAAIEELTRLAAIDLGDFHQFTLDVSSCTSTSQFTSAPRHRS